MIFGVTVEMDRKEYIKKIIINHLQFGLGLLLYIIVTNITGIGCPIRRVIHMPCPACGITRSWIEVLKLNFDKAIEYHPLFLFLPLYVYIMICSDSAIIKKIPRWIFLTFAILGGILIFSVYIYRIINGFGPV